MVALVDVNAYCASRYSGIAHDGGLASSSGRHHHSEPHPKGFLTLGGPQSQLWKPRIAENLSVPESSGKREGVLWGGNNGAIGG